MSDQVYKVVELVGSSENGVTEAIENAVTRAAKTIRRIGWFEVVNIRGSVADGKAQRYQVTIKAGFTLEG